MAKLIVRTEGMPEQVIQLKLGANRLGRSPDNDFPISHPTVSTYHCEIVLTDGAVTVRDKGSTNGTFVNNETIREAQLAAGQTLRLGDVDLFVESTDFAVAIPKFNHVELPAPPVVAKDGGVMCSRHPRARVTHQCTHCHELMCEDCLHRLRRRGGKLFNLCPVCSGHCDLIGAPQKKKKRTFLGILEKTVKLTFARGGDSESNGER
jgi:pSer/pThr/pTyr-binding forkhead associated (FHA) protein